MKKTVVTVLLMAAATCAALAQQPLRSELPRPGKVQGNKATFSLTPMEKPLLTPEGIGKLMLDNPVDVNEVVDMFFDQVEPCKSDLVSASVYNLLYRGKPVGTMQVTDGRLTALTITMPDVQCTEELHIGMPFQDVIGSGRAEVVLHVVDNAADIEVRQGEFRLHGFTVENLTESGRAKMNALMGKVGKKGVDSAALQLAPDDIMPDVTVTGLGIGKPAVK